MRPGASILFAAALATPAMAADSPPAAPAAPLDPDIQAIVQGISSERIQRSIYVLSSFKTRHTLSDPTPSGDGIGGAASWIRAEFERASKDTGGRLKVDLDTFEQPPAPPRIPPARLHKQRAGRGRRRVRNGRRPRDRAGHEPLQIPGHDRVPRRRRRG